MSDHTPADDALLVRAHLRAAAVWALACVVAGLVVNALLLWPDLQGGHAWLSYGRVRVVHTNIPLYGWFWPVFLATVLYSLPRSLNISLWQPWLARIGLYIWNAVLLLGVVLVLRGNQQPREYSELPLLIDVLLAVTFLLPAATLFVPLYRERRRVGWLGGLVMTLLVLVPVLAVLGNPPFTNRFDAQATEYEGQNILGYCLGGFVIAAAFLSLDPDARAALQRRRWAWAFVAASVAAFCIGVAWDVALGDVPPPVQAIILSCSAFLMVPLAIMMWPLRQLDARPDTRPARLAFCLGTALYMLAGLEGFTQFAAPVRALVQFTAWMAGHAHLAMAGAMMLYVIGASLMLAAQTQVVSPSRWRRAEAHVWTWTVAMVLLAVLFTANGFRDGVALVRHNAHDLDAWSAQRPFWYATAGVGLFLTVDVGRYTAWMWTTEPLRRFQTMPTISSAAATPPIPVGRLASGFAVAGVFAIVFINLFFSAPAAPQTADTPRRQRIQHGKHVYIREGCVACHTMQVRAVDNAARFGPPSTLAEYQRDLPHQLGTRRIGPDLLRIGGKYSDEWHTAHLANPRVLFPDSPMPAYDFLTEDDRAALITYLQSLDTAIRPTPGSADATAAHATPGWDTYSQLCIRCHGADGAGHGPDAQAGGFNARDFTDSHLMLSRRDADLSRAIRNGIPGTEMPAWDSLDDGAVAMLVDTMRAFRRDQSS